MIQMINEKKYGKLNWQINNKENYLEIKNYNDAQEWGKAHYKQWAKCYKRVMGMAQKSINEEKCVASIECYCGEDYRHVNNFMRGESDNKYHSYKELADILSIVLCNAPRIPCDLILYRMVSE